MSLPEEIRASLDFWRDVARGAAKDHPSHLVVRELEAVLRRAGGAA